MYKLFEYSIVLYILQSIYTNQSQNFNPPNQPDNEKLVSEGILFQINITFVNKIVTRQFSLCTYGITYMNLHSYLETQAE
jgi:hypothetical protein